MLSFHRLVATLLVLPATACLGQSTDYGFEYFNTVGRVMGEAKGLSWTAEICAQSFPETKAPIDAALSTWTERNREAISTLDSQFDVIQTYWANLPARDKGALQTKQQMVDQLNAQRQVLERKLALGSQAEFKKLCSVYAVALQSKRLDIEARWGPQMAIIRKGPQ